MTVGQPALVSRKPEIHLWWRVLMMGLLSFSIGIMVMILTGNPILFPTVLMLGSFAVPAAYVAFFYDHRQLSKLTLPTIILGFLYGGVLGVFASALLEPIFVSRLDPSTTFVVGLIEEFAKILGVLMIARHRPSNDSDTDGQIRKATKNPLKKSHSPDRSPVAFSDCNRFCKGTLRPSFSR
jgi:hypothetical protein